VTTNFTGEHDVAFGVAIQADGKIVAAGGAGSAYRFALARYNPNGTLNPTFSGDGKVVTNFSTQYERAFAVAIQADGKIVAAGEGSGGLGGRFALVRYNPDGTLDLTFSGDGKLLTNFTTGFDQAFAVAIQPDGKIVAANFRRFALTRYNPDGTLDPTFGGDGKVTTNFTAGDDYANGVAIQADGRMVAAGRAGGSGGRFALARYLAG
jgi:uncharacterized delta-60 repeat protein